MHRRVYVCMCACVYVCMRACVCMYVCLHATQVSNMIKGSMLEGHVAWGNDEADPKVGWSSIYAWRADARYAAMVPKVCG